MTQTHYDILGVKKNATIDEIKQSYRRLALEHHPDKGGDQAIFQQIQEAYECLTDDDRRNQYDFELEHGGKHHFNFGSNMMPNRMPENIMEFFRTHIEENLWESLGRSRPNQIPNKEVILNITLMDVFYGGEKTVDFERRAIVDVLGNTIRLPQLATQTCLDCNGTGIVVQVASTGFFMQQTTSPCNKCSGEGFILINGCQLSQRKCRFRHKIPIGILNGEQFIFENEGDILYNKKTKQFNQNHVVVIINYDLAESNRLLAHEYNFPNIIITGINFGDIHYEYTGSIFEFITGTKFNLPLLNGRYLLVKISSLDKSITIKEYGLPQITNKHTGAVEFRNAIITFKVRPLDTTFSICESDKVILRRIMHAQYPKVKETDAIIVEFN